MNKVFNINLGGIPFTIDEDAYEHLGTYLKTIHNHFRSSEGYEEITTDIEARLAELFQERLGNRPIVTLKDVKHVIAIMGTPEDFGANPLTEEAPKSSSGSSSASGKWKIKTGKRLFRNPEEEVIGGVCSGIAAYLGIEDPLWVRLVFVLLFFTGGFAIPLYIILWAVLPKAESASDRLAMRGDPVNASNIGKIIEEELESVSKKVSKLGDELKAEFGSKKKSSQQNTGDEKAGDAQDTGDHVRAAVAEGILILGKTIRALIEVLQKIVKPIVFTIGLVLVICLGLIWVAIVGGTFWGMPFSGYLHPASPILTTLGVVNLLIFIGIPLLMIILGVMRLFMRTHFKPRWTAGLWIFWTVNLVSLMFVLITTAKSFSASGEVSLGTATDFTTSDTLHIDLVQPPTEDVLLRFGDMLYLSDEQLISNDVHLSIGKSKSDWFEIQRSHFSRGTTVNESKQIGNSIQYEYALDGNKLTLPASFSIPNGNKWRGQRVNIKIGVPEGKWLIINSPDWNVYRTVNYVEHDSNYPFPGYGDGYAWKMGPNGMTAPDFIREKHQPTDN